MASDGSTLFDAADGDDVLEVGCLIVQVVGTRNVKLSGGGMVDLFLNKQVNPYCKVTLGGCELTSGLGVRTTAGHAWNREQMFFPVKVPLSCVVGASGRRNHSSGEKYGDAGGVKKNSNGKGSKRGLFGKVPSAVDDDVDCGSKKASAAAMANASHAQEVWRRLTLKAQVFHREEGAGTGAGASGRMTTGGGGTSRRGLTGRGTASDKIAAASTAAMVTAKADDSATGDRLVGECSLNLVEVVSGRAPHFEEWVPLDTEGDLRLSLNYDSVGEWPRPGDTVVLLCLSNRLDFFPMPIWDSDNDPARPGSPSWVWAGGASLGQGGRGTGDVGRGEGFRVEEVGDDFFLLSYATPEGWRCAVEVHRFLICPDPTVPRRWTLSGVRDHAISTPAVAVMRGALIRASQDESLWEGTTGLATEGMEGARWIAGRWWTGGLDRIRNDVLFAVGMLDHASFEQSEAKRESPQQSDAEPLLIDRSNGVELSQPQTSHVDLDVSLDAPRSADHDRSDAGSSRSDKGVAEQKEDDAATDLCEDGAKQGGWKQAAFTGATISSPDTGTRRSSENGSHGEKSGGGISSAQDRPPTSFPVEEAEHQGTAKSAARETERNGTPGAVHASRVDASMPQAPQQQQQQQQQQHLCPITRCPMEDPAVAADGYTYEREAIERWLSEHDTSPVTGNVLETKVVFKNWSLISSPGDYT